MKRFTLVGVDGNAYAIMGYTRRAMKTAGFSKEEIDKMLEDAKSSDYDHLLCVCMEWVDKSNEKLGLENEDDEE